MRKFETLLLLSPELSADARDGILNDLKKVPWRISISGACVTSLIPSTR